MLWPLLLAACAQPGGQPGGMMESSAVDAASMREADPRARIHTELAARYYAMRKYDVVLQELREALQADVNFAPAYNMLGLVHGELGEDREAEGHFRRAIELGRNYSEAHNNFGFFLCQRRRYDEAIGQFELALRNPLYAGQEKALANAGLCALLQGDMERSERYLVNALNRQPGQPVALLAMAEWHLRDNNPLGARSRLDQLSRQGALNAAALWLGVRIERRLGNREAEGNYGYQLRTRYPEARETRWLLNGSYDMVGGML